MHSIRNGHGWTAFENGTTDHLHDIWGNARDDVFIADYRGTVILLRSERRCG